MMRILAFGLVAVAGCGGADDDGLVTPAVGSGDAMAQAVDDDGGAVPVRSMAEGGSDADGADGLAVSSIALTPCMTFKASGSSWLDYGRASADTLTCNDICEGLGGSCSERCSAEGGALFVESFAGDVVPICDLDTELTPRPAVTCVTTLARQLAQSSAFSCCCGGI